MRLEAISLPTWTYYTNFPPKKSKSSWKTKIWKNNSATHSSHYWKTDHSTQRVISYEPATSCYCPKSSWQESWNTHKHHMIRNHVLLLKKSPLDIAQMLKYTYQPSLSMLLANMDFWAIFYDHFGNEMISLPWLL